MAVEKEEKDRGDKKQSEADRKIIERAMKDFKFSAEGSRRNRRNYADDINFVFKSKQWPEDVKNEREGDERPCLTTNKLKKFVKNVAGDIRQNMPDVKFRPVDSAGDVIIADILTDIKRTINTCTEAKMADKIAAENALAGGFGYYRFVTEFEDDGFNQIIVKKRIPNSLTVYLDISALDYLYKDGNFAFVTEKMRKSTFERMYPNATPIDFQSAMDDYEQYSEWIWADFVRVAEYFYKVPTTKSIVQMEDGSTFELKDGLTKEQIEQQTGLAVVNEREYKTQKIMWCKMVANDIIEGPIEWPGKFIPIIPVLGDEESLDGTRTFYSLIREAKDPQRMYNYWRTMAAELIALAPKAPYVGTAAQFEGYEEMWDQANVKNYSRLPYNPDSQAPGRPQRERPPDLPSAAVNEANIATADIMDSMGRFAANIGQEGNERSGRAIIARQKEGDATTFSFVDNLHMSVIYEGEILIDLIPKVMDNERVLRMASEDEREKVVQINTVIRDPRTLEDVVINDLSLGKFDVVPDAGASFATKRSEIASSLLDVLQFAPNLAPAVIPRLAKVIDIPDAAGFAEEVRALSQPQPEEGATPPPAPGGEQAPPGI